MFRSLCRDYTAMAGLVCLLLVVISAILAPVIAPRSPIEQDYSAILQPPSPEFPFGTDELGRDILSRVLWGGRESLRVGILAVVLAATTGAAFGVIAGYYGSLVDELIMRLVDILLAFPSILLMIAIVAILGANLQTVLLAVSIGAVPVFVRIVRGSALSVKTEEYVLAARAIGATDIRLMLVHILPNVMAPLMIASTLMLGWTILMTAGLSYIGLGAQPPSPEWGAMLNSGRPYIRDAWWLSIFPGLAIFISVLAVNLAGDGLRDALDPKMRGVHR